MLSSVRAATPAAGHRGPPGRRGRTPGPVAKRSDRGRSDVGRVPIMSTSPDAGRCKRRTIVLPVPFPKACWSRICGGGWTGPKRTAPETRSGETGGRLESDYFASMATGNSKWWLSWTTTRMLIERPEPATQQPTTWAAADRRRGYDTRPAAAVDVQGAEGKYPDWGGLEPERGHASRGSRRISRC